MTISANYPFIRPTLLLDFANGEALDPRITFSRPTTGTYYDGKTSSVAEQNLILQSETFENASWTKFGCTATANSTTAPDGQTTADTITEGVTTTAHGPFQAVTVSSGLAYTWSGYVKANGRTIVQLDCQATVSVYRVEFDLTGVTTTNRSGTGTATITSVGSGWYRITATATSTGGGTGYWQLLMCNAANGTSYTGDGTSGIFIWGAQLEQRSAVSAYTVTTTQAITNYIPTLQTAAAGIARFQHNPTTGESLGLLIEEQRTNLVTYSEQFDNAAWTKGNSTISSNTIVAPDGTLTGDKLFENSTAGEHYTERTSNITVTNGVAYTFSWYAKKAERTKMRAYFFAMNNLIVFYDLDTGTATYSSGGTSYSVGMQDVGNGWWRCFATSTTTATAFNVALALVSTGTTVNYTGNGWNGLYIWGAQLEAGAFSTSYVPTVASQVTRSSDQASMTGTNFSSWFNNAEGSFYSEYMFNINTNLNAFPVLFSVTDASGFGNNHIRLIKENLSNSAIVDVFSAGASQASFTVANTTTLSTLSKVVIGIKKNDINVAFNGTAQTNDTACSVPVVDRLNFGGYGSGINTSITVKKFAYYPIRVTNTNLAALTGS